MITRVAGKVRLRAARSRLLALGSVLGAAVFALVAFAAPAEAGQPPGGPDYNCAVYQNIYPGPNHTVVLEQQVHHCTKGGVHESFVGEDLWFSRGDTTLKEVHHNLTQCQWKNHTLGTCVRDFVFRFHNPAGKQNWYVTARVVWTGIFGKTGEFEHFLKVRL